MEIATKEQLRGAFLRWAVVTVPLILLLGFASSRIAPAGAENRWYAALARPSLTPPDWVFPVAWGSLYILMGVALAMIINARGSRLRGVAIVLFVVQLLLNLAWSPLFFGMHQVSAALILLIGLLVAALATTLVFGRIRAAAAWLMVPYLAWLCFAGLLNWQIGKLNPNASTLVPSSSSAQMSF
ncbi:MAG: TspO/MBR family protein [Sphingomonas sp.]|uniref:TspO/MBR family protein n=1 Tax=Sphingomonas sp. TaxID=28214 RepID=UPI003F81F1B5